MYILKYKVHLFLFFVNYLASKCTCTMYVLLCYINADDYKTDRENFISFYIQKRKNNTLNLYAKLKHAHNQYELGTFIVYSNHTDEILLLLFYPESSK